MAEIISAVKSQRDVYDWPKWTNGKAWRVKKGKDFDCSVKAFRAALYSHASRKGMTVVSSAAGDVVEFQFSKPAKKPVRKK